MSDLESNKKTVVAFFTRAYNDHDPDTADGAAAFVERTKGWIARFPKVSLEIKRVIAEGDLVVTHDLVRLAPEDRGAAGIDIFRLEKGKIVEHWDARQP